MNKITETIIEADPKLPVIRMARDFAATPGQLFRAHTDPALFARWVGPEAMTTRIEHWDARTGGNWQYVAERDGGGVPVPLLLPRGTAGPDRADLHVRRRAPT